MQNISFFGQYFKVTFWIIVIFEILSFLGHNFNIVNSIIFGLLVLTTLVITIWKVEFGFWIVAVELFIGSLGYLFFIDFDEFRISIRLGLFLAVMLGWLINTIRTKKFEFYKSYYWKPLLLLSVFLLLGLIFGLRNGNDLKDIFFDFNAYLYFGLIFVAFSVIKSKERVNNLIQILVASISALFLKTIFILFYFSHVFNENLISMVYRWIRDTRVGEISPIVSNFYRVFFQGHIWALFLFVIFLLIIILLNKDQIGKRNYIFSWIIMIISSLMIIISFSRSFWLALSINIILIFWYLIKKEKIKIKQVIKILVISLLVLIIELGFITGLVNIKLPNFGNDSSVSIASLIRDRISDTDEAAFASRYELLKPLTYKYLENPFIGSGFGTTVTYETKDPRSKGNYTTYAFEWGYLDILTKIGLFGFLAYLFFIYKIFKQGINLLKISSNRNEYVLILGLLFSLCILLLVHMTTPYLNHPLGIFLLIIISSIFYSKTTQQSVKLEA
ncbi:MAG: O-antigen ligase family protein [Candidatus Kerfeldbacteria bacterium]